MKLSKSLTKLLRVGYVPDIKMGENVLNELKWDDNALIISSKRAFKQFKDYYPVVFANEVVLVKKVTEEALEEVSKKIQGKQTIIGIGTGRPIDFAKVLSSRYDCKLIAIPTATVCNVFATDKSVVNKNGAVSTILSKAPNELYVDTTLMSKAPTHLNNAGISDVLSISTALFDWKLAEERVGEEIQDDTYKLANEILTTAIVEFPSMDFNKPKDIETLCTLLILAGYVTNLHGSGRPESGSEHVFARAFESKPGFDTLLHGESVAMGIMVMNRIQGNPLPKVEKLIKQYKILENIRKPVMSMTEFRDMIGFAKELRPDRYTVLNTLGSEDERISKVAEFLSSEGFIG